MYSHHLKKVKISTLTMLVILGMATPVVYAEHSTKDFELSRAENEILTKYLSNLDKFAMLNVIIYNGKTDEEILKMARESVTKNFNDPDSAKFRNERVFRTKVHPRNIETEEVFEKNGIYVCGEVNGKNLYGAYAGYRDYWGGHFIVELEDEDNRLFHYILLHYCFRK